VVGRTQQSVEKSVRETEGSGIRTKEAEGSFERLHLRSDVEKGTRLAVRLPCQSPARE